MASCRDTQGIPVACLELIWDGARGIRESTMKYIRRGAVRVEAPGVNTISGTP